MGTKKCPSRVMGNQGDSINIDCSICLELGGDSCQRPGKWVPFPASCELCRGEVEVFKEEDLGCGWSYAKDHVKCKNCGAMGFIKVISEDSLEIIWDDKT